MKSLNLALDGLIGKPVIIVWSNGDDGKYMLLARRGCSIQIEPKIPSKRIKVWAPIGLIDIIVHDVCPVDFPADLMSLPARARSVIDDMGASTISDVAQLSASKMMTRVNVSSGTVKSINSELAKYGLRLKK